MGSVRSAVPPVAIPPTPHPPPPHPIKIRPRACSSQRIPPLSRKETEPTERPPPPPSRIPLCLQIPAPTRTTASSVVVSTHRTLPPPPSSAAPPPPLALLGDALRRASMPRRAYAALRDEERALPRLRRLLVAAAAVCVAVAAAAAAGVSLGIVFPAEPAERPFCRERRMLEALPAAASSREEEPEAYRYRGGAFYMTTAEAADFYWMVVFVPSAVLFAASAAYLVAGISVAYAAPRRHPCICVVENNFCASKRGGVRCLAILNAVFAVIFGLMAIILGSTLLALGSSCSVPLFWCYEITAWGLVILYGGTAFFLRRKAAVVLDEGDYATHNVGLEMLETTIEVTPEMQRSVNDGFKTWMGSSLLSSDDEEEASDDYIEHNVPSPTASVQHRQENDLES